MHTFGDILVSVTGRWQTPRAWVVSGCDGQGKNGQDASQPVIRWLKDRRLELEPNGFNDGPLTDTEDLSRLWLEPISFSVSWRTDTWESSQIGLEPISFAVGQRTDVWGSSRLGLKSIDSSRMGLESINSFGHILGKKFRVSQFWEHWDWHTYTSNFFSRDVKMWHWWWIYIFWTICYFYSDPHEV